MYQLFLNQEDVNHECCTLDKETFHHLSRVVRLKKGEAVALILGESEKRIVRIEDLSLGEMKFTVLSCEKLTPPMVKITLFQSLPKGDKFSDIINYCTQLSCFNIVPVISSRTEFHGDQKKMASKLDRWRKVAYSASQQSCQDRVTRVDDVVSIKQMDITHYGIDVLLVPWEEERVSLKNVLTEIGQSRPIHIGICIGPEGGFSSEDISIFQTFGGRTVSLGKTILRTEIAATVCISQLKFYLD